jgi:PAS domain S-box-containing protein
MGGATDRPGGSIIPLDGLRHPVGPAAGPETLALALGAFAALPNASAVLVFDTESRYIIARGPALAALSSQGLEGRLAADALPPEQWAVYEPLYRAALEGETRSLEVASLDGKRWYLVEVGPVRTGDHDIIGGVAVAVSITGRKRAEEQYRALLESAPEAMVVVDAQGIIQLANAECERMFGYSREALVKSSVEMLMPERFRDLHREGRVGFSAALGVRPMGAGLDLWGCRQDDSEFPVDISLSSLETDDGVLVTAVIRDVEVERRTAESLRLLETLQSTAPVGLVFVDRNLRIQRINETLAAFSDAPMKDQMGRLVVDVAPGIWPQLEPAFRRVLASGETLVNQDVHLVLADTPGQVRTFLASFYPVRVRGEIVGIGAVAIDITDRRDAEEFRQAVMQSMAEGLYVLDSKGALMYMNAAAERMLGYSEQELRGKPIHEAVHYQHADGSAFAAEECELCQLRSDGRPFRKSEEAFTGKDGTIFPVAFSAAPLGGGPDGRGVVVAFHDTTEERAEQTRVQRELNMLTWVGRIRDALDDDRLVLYSQPIVPLGNGEPSEELLVRMLGRDGEVIAPASFLPAAEKFGLIGEIDRWVIGQAARLAAKGRHVHVHANLSADSISNLDLLPVIKQEILDSNADPAKLGFEVTETALMGNIQAGEAFARGLADIGCSLALDDFGTGFGGFTYLKRLPFTHLKIDIEFVRDLPTNEANQHLVKGIVNLAKGFGQQTIAEGVEDAETLQLLRDYGVDYAQGYHIGRPAPITQA